MFYAGQPSDSLRFGDVVRGFVSATPEIDRPRFENVIGKLGEFGLAISRVPFSVVLSPCCSIADKMVSLAPLIQIRPGFLKNPYFAEDLTRINRLMEPEQSVDPHTWKALPEPEKQKRLATGRAYALMEVFVYASHDLLPPYTLDRKEGNVKLNVYMVDFRQAYRVTCESIKSPQKQPLEAKYLELSVRARRDLREKIAHYYGRTPQEDVAELQLIS
jgi:hypothetical protein